jgi:Uma2 family endonuclease
VTQAARQLYSFRDYLDLEEMSPAVKHEFLDGAVWAMAGGTPDHAAIAANVIVLLRAGLGGRRGRVFTSDLRVRVKKTGLSTYPDVSIVCGALELDPDDPKGHTVTNPTVLVEVLSPSTEDYDAGEKRQHYQDIPSAREIVLVAHDARRVDVWRRTGDTWNLHTVTAGDVTLESVQCVMPIEEIYLDPLAQP